MNRLKTDTFDNRVYIFNYIAFKTYLKWEAKEWVYEISQVQIL